MRDLLFGAVMLGLVPASLIRPWIGILVWTWLGLMNPHRLTYVLKAMPFAQIVAVAVLVGMLFRRDYRGIVWTRSLVCLALLFLVATLSNFSAWAPDAAWIYWERVAKMVGMVFATALLIHGRQRIVWLLVVMGLSIGFYGFKGGLFTVLTGGEFRVQGPDKTMIGGNTFLGLAMVMVLPLLIALINEHGKRWTRWLFGLTSALTFISIPFTYSRGALLGLAVVLPGIFPRLRKLLYAAPLLIPLAFVAKDLLPERLIHRADTIQSYEEDTSAMQRIRAWNVAWSIALKYPLTGAGFDFEEYPDPQRWWSHVPPDMFEVGKSKVHVSHSIYFSVLAYHGFPGVVLFVAMLLFAFLDFRRLEKQTRDDAELQWIGRYARALRIGLVGYGVSGAFINAAYFDLMYLFVVCAALFHREVLAVQKSRASEKSRLAGSAGGGGTPLAPEIAISPTGSVPGSS